MTLKPGDRIGAYEVLAPLGAGGMGEVYHARDVRLDRDVAIKVLPEGMTRDAERLARFEREARLLAALNHPNIAAVYGFEEHRLGAGVSHYLVLEYVDGETLAKRLNRGALPVDETVDVSKQVAEALEAAHEKGIIHRDLKPGNVMIRPDGSVKVLDFGLAKAVAEESSGAILADSPTITANYTKPGVVLGTAAYMSPEQARGRAVDKRTDIWSLGVILYESLTGAGPFMGETATDTIGAILHKDIEFDRLPRATPRAVRQLLQRCLQRDKHNRLQAAGDARIELEEVARQLETGMIERGDGAAIRKRAWAWPVVTAVLTAALGLSLLRGSGEGDGSQATRPGGARVVTELKQLTSMPGMQTDPAISPDGRLLLYVSRDGNDRDVFLLRVGGERAINLTADSAADDYDPAFSPDGQKIAFRSSREGGGLFVMGATGESPRRVSDEGFDPAWSPDGTALVYTTEDVEGPYSRSSVAQLWIVNIRTREKRLLTNHDAVAPCYSPSGKHIVFWAAIAGVRDIFTIPVGGGDPQPITDDQATDWNPFFSPDGRTLYFISDRSGSPDLWRVAIDPTTGHVTGEMHPVTAGVTAIDHATITADGDQIAFMAPLRVSWIERYPFDAETERIVGKGETVYASTSVLHQFDVTEDGQRLVFRTAAPREDLVVMNVDGTGRRRLMDDLHRDRGPRWTPDGAWLVFYSNRGGLYDAWRIHPDGTDAQRLTATSRHDVTGPAIDPNGRYLCIQTSMGRGGATVLFALDQPLAGIDTPLPLPEPTVTDFVPLMFSPNGRLLAGTVFGAVAVYDFQSEQVRRIRAPGGGAMHVTQNSGLDWIDGNRFVVWDEAHDTAFTYNVKASTAQVLDGIEGPSDIRVVEGGKAIIVNRLRAESDVWMLRLDRINDRSSAGQSFGQSSAASARRAHSSGKESG